MNRGSSSSTRDLDRILRALQGDAAEPLRHVRGLLELLAKDHAHLLPPEGAHLLDRARSEADRLATMLSAVATYTRVAGHTAVLGGVRLAECVDVARARTHGLCTETGATLVLEIPPDLVVRGDPTLLANVLTDLVTVALRTGGASPRVRVVAAPIGDELVNIDVHLAGTEPSSDTPTLFELFPRDGEPVGLGLARRTAEALGGSLERIVPSPGLHVRLCLFAARPRRSPAGDGN